eukprot:COSAG01_NODE_18070_length_1102_cov_4.066611_1_plen_46_part_10
MIDRDGDDVDGHQASGAGLVLHWSRRPREGRGSADRRHLPIVYEVT